MITGHWPSEAGAMVQSFEKGEIRHDRTQRCFNSAWVVSPMEGRTWNRMEASLRIYGFQRAIWLHENMVYVRPALEISEDKKEIR